MESSDEMAELWFQLLLENPADRPLLEKSNREKTKNVLLEYGRSKLANETNDPDLLMITAQARVAEGNTRSALENFLRVVKLEPDRFNAWFNIGTIFRQVGQLETAQKAFAKVIQIDPNDADPYGSIGGILLQQGRFDKAEAFLTHAMKLNPNDPITAKALELLEQGKRIKSEKESSESLIK